MICALKYGQIFLECTIFNTTRLDNLSFLSSTSNSDVKLRSHGQSCRYCYCSGLFPFLLLWCLSFASCFVVFDVFASRCCRGSDGRHIACLAAGHCPDDCRDTVHKLGAEDNVRVVKHAFFQADDDELTVGEVSAQHHTDILRVR